MGKMCRLKIEAATAFMMQEALPQVQARAQQHGLPINEQTAALLKDLLHFGFMQGLSATQAKYGFFTGITDESPHFAHFGAYALVNSMQGARPIANVAPPVAAPAPVFAAPPAAPAPMQPAQPWAGHSHIPPPPPGAVIPGQPLQPLRTPAAMAGSHSVPPHAVPVHAPAMNGDHPPSLTQPPADPLPTILS
jgi:hypothetical protein